MLKKVLAILAVAIVGLLVVIATRPDTYHVERAITIKAPPEAVFPAIADLKTFTEWSPWDKRDPAMKKTFSATTTGVGATYEWQGNKEVGSGKMTVTESAAPAKVRHKLEFLEPFAAVADVEFDVAPGAATGESKVTWGIDGKNNFMGKAVGLVMDMDKTLGKDFDQGLGNLKQLVESKPAPPPAAAAAAPAEAPAAKP